MPGINLVVKMKNKNFPDDQLMQAELENLPQAAFHVYRRFADTGRGYLERCQCVQSGVGQFADPRRVIGGGPEHTVQNLVRNQIDNKFCCLLDVD